MSGKAIKMRAFLVVCPTSTRLGLCSSVTAVTALQFTSTQRLGEEVLIRGEGELAGWYG